MIALRAFVPALVSGLAALAVCTTAARGQTFSNPAPMIMPGGAASGAASLYPSAITVTGAPASIAYVSVTLNDFSHTWVADVHALLVSPTGQRILLMANTNGQGDATDATLTFIPDGTVLLPSSNSDVVSGVYACSTYGVSNPPPPAPGGVPSSTLLPLLGTNANGNWALYVWDDSTDDGGSIAGGWSITFNDAPPQPVPTVFTYQGVLSAGNTPLNGAANVRFSLCDNAIAPIGTSQIGPALTRSFPAGTDGQITAALDFGPSIGLNRALWLNIEVESPPGSGFVTLSPRQPITPTPQAQLAQFAQNAANAATATTANTLAPGRQRIRGDAGSAPQSPGIWFASPVNAPIDRAFVGQLDDSNVGFFNSQWAFLVNSNGNTVLGDSSGTAPPQRLTVNGSIQLTSGATTPNRLAFGVLGNLQGTAESTDAVYFQRINASANRTDLRLYIGDDPGLPPNAGGDAFSLWSTNGTASGGTENFRFQSDGVAAKPGGGAWAVLSDPRTKHHVAPLSGTLDRLLSLRGYSFLYNDDRIAKGLARPGPQIGLMADEVARVFPDWVSTDDAGTLYVSERATTALMVEALRDLRREKDAELSRLREQNEQLQRRLEAIEKRLAPAEK